MEDISLRPTSAAAGIPQQDQQHPEEMAVMIRDAVKIYDGNNVVLKGLNMSVPKGKM